jgi:cytochrome c oxidase subunit III
MRPSRARMDLSALPDVVFGSRDIMWWGTVGFMLIEGFTLVLCAVVYVYLHQNFAQWPPADTPLPSLGLPTLQVALMLVSLPVVRWLRGAARRFDLGAVRIGLVVAALFGAAFVGLRIAEATVSLHVRWDANAYGSAQWLILGSHFTLLAIEFVEVAGMALIFWLAPVEEKHFSDVADMVDYWWFMVLIWMPMYALCFLLPQLR